MQIYPKIQIRIPDPFWYFGEMIGVGWCRPMLSPRASCSWWRLFISHHSLTLDDQNVNAFIRVLLLDTRMLVLSRNSQPLQKYRCWAIFYEKNVRTELLSTRKSKTVSLITILKLIFILLNFLKWFTCLCVCVFWSYVIVNHFNFSIIFMGHV